MIYASQISFEHCKQALKAIAVLLQTYRPPCIRIRGLPVLVIDTSSRRPRRWPNGALQCSWPFAATRRLRDTGRDQDFCIVLMCSEFNGAQVHRES